MNNITRYVNALYAICYCGLSQSLCLQLCGIHHSTECSTQSCQSARQSLPGGGLSTALWGSQGLLSRQTGNANRGGEEQRKHR